jgi:hypothetical protein
MGKQKPKKLIETPFLSNPSHHVLTNPKTWVGGTICQNIHQTSIIWKLLRSAHKRNYHLQSVRTLISILSLTGK